ncbi:DUF2784 domain-containing protein [Povalibacter sp.]|uniref:DUF2784 domain-containing protein n=1 Tax=Povalibacter sp. TaxID=1962978 RepID=UPI002F407132
MIFGALADVVLIIHLAFIVFVVAGGLLALRWPRIVWLHLPAVAWGIWIEFSGRYCPLTPLENSLRVRGGESDYSGGFIDHYITALIYPDGLTRNAQLAIGSFVLLLNLVVYAILIRRSRRTR